MAWLRSGLQQWLQRWDGNPLLGLWTKRGRKRVARPGRLWRCVAPLRRLWNGPKALDARRPRRARRQSSNVDVLLRLPDVLLNRIAAYLPQRDCFRVRRVSSRHELSLLSVPTLDCRGQPLGNAGVRSDSRVQAAAAIFRPLKRKLV